MAIKTGRKKPPREVVVSASKLESLAADTGALIELTPTHAYLAARPGVVYVAAIPKAAA